MTPDRSSPEVWTAEAWREGLGLPESDAAQAAALWLVAEKRAALKARYRELQGQAIEALVLIEALDSLFADHLRLVRVRRPLPQVQSDMGEA